jgi:hypothetical protein
VPLSGGSAEPGRLMVDKQIQMAQKPSFREVKMDPNAGSTHPVSRIPYRVSRIFPLYPPTSARASAAKAVLR